MGNNEKLEITREVCNSGEEARNLLTSIGKDKEVSGEDLNRLNQLSSLRENLNLDTRVNLNEVIFKMLENGFSIKNQNDYDAFKKVLKLGGLVDIKYPENLENFKVKPISLSYKKGEKIKIYTKEGDIFLRYGYISNNGKIEVDKSWLLDSDNTSNNNVFDTEGIIGQIDENKCSYEEIEKIKNKFSQDLTIINSKIKKISDRSGCIERYPGLQKVFELKGEIEKELGILHRQEEAIESSAMNKGFIELTDKIKKVNSLLDEITGVHDDIDRLENIIFPLRVEIDSKLKDLSDESKMDNELKTKLESIKNIEEGFFSLKNELNQAYRSCDWQKISVIKGGISELETQIKKINIIPKIDSLYINQMMVEKYIIKRGDNLPKIIKMYFPELNGKKINELSKYITQHPLNKKMRKKLERGIIHIGDEIVIPFKDISLIPEYKDKIPKTTPDIITSKLATNRNKEETDKGKNTKIKKLGKSNVTESTKEKLTYEYTLKEFKNELNNWRKSDNLEKLGRFQILVGTKVDMLPGPNTYNKYIEFVSENDDSKNLSLSQLVEKHKNEIDEKIEGVVKEIPKNISENEEFNNEELEKFWEIVYLLPSSNLGDLIQKLSSTKIHQLNRTISKARRFGMLLKRKLKHEVVANDEIEGIIKKHMEFSPERTKLIDLGAGLKMHFGEYFKEKTAEENVTTFFLKLFHKESFGKAGKGAKKYAASLTGSLGLAQTTGRFVYNAKNSDNKFNPFNPEEAIPGAIKHFLSRFTNNSKLGIATALDIYNKGNSGSLDLGTMLSKKSSKKDKYGNPDNYVYQVLSREVY